MNSNVDTNIETQFEPDTEMSHHERVAIDLIATKLLSQAPVPRAHAAAVVRYHGFGAYIGGHHVAIHRFTPDGKLGARLALIIDTAMPDWN
jgi:hypothetical protein